MSNRIITGSVSDEMTLETTKTHIAGVVSKLVHINSTNDNQILLPPAPDGTVIYDSTGDARGTGKANLNLLTEVDPKYGDIAATQNEAVARAFEGQVKNSDGRLGDNGDWGTAAGSSITVTNGLISAQSASAANGLTVQTGLAPFSSSREYRVVMTNVTSNQSFTVRIGGIYVADETIPTKAGEDVDVIIGGQDSTSFNISGGGSSATISFESMTITPVTEEVVTDRVDMFGLEQFDMVMKDDEVFDMVQSQSTTFGDTDVPTVDSVRPDSFFAVYDGQTGIVKGKCVKWSTLTDVQKRKVAAYMKERLWVNEDGDLTFTSIVQDSKRGLGNGDWFNVNSATGALEYKSGTPVLSRNGFPFVKDTERKGVFTDNNGSHYYVLGTRNC